MPRLVRTLALLILIIALEAKLEGNLQKNELADSLEDQSSTDIRNIYRP
jgi:hypothetical protein